MPSATIDPIVIASRFVTDVQSIISREKDAGQFGVITVGSFQAGTVGNIIPDSAQLKLTSVVLAGSSQAARGWCSARCHGIGARGQCARARSEGDRWNGCGGLG